MTWFSLKPLGTATLNPDWTQAPIFKNGRNRSKYIDSYERQVLMSKKVWVHFQANNWNRTWITHAYNWINKLRYLRWAKYRLKPTSQEKVLHSKTKFYLELVATNLALFLRRSWRCVEKSTWMFQSRGTQGKNPLFTNVWSNGIDTLFEEQAVTQASHPNSDFAQSSWTLRSLAYRQCQVEEILITHEWASC